MRSPIACLVSAALLLSAAPRLHAGAVTVDGTLDASYGFALTTQTTQTQFGNSNLGQVGFANGSELDVGHAIVQSQTLHLFLGGNLESNFNKLEIFFECIGGGQNKLRGDNPNVDFNGLNRMGDDGSGNGLTFDAGYDADYWIGVTGGDAGGGNYQLFANYAELLTGGGGGGYYLGQTGAASNGVLSGGSNPNNILVTIDNGNTGGVDGGCGASSGAGVNKGVELEIPLAALGNPTGCIKISAFVNGGGHDYVSNQVLGPLPAGSCNLGEPRAVNFSQQSGDQSFTVCPPVSDIGIVSACVSDSAKKRCVDTLFTYQPWHVAFLVQNKGNKDVLNWSFGIDLINKATMQVIHLKIQEPVPQPLPAGGPPVGVNWVAPAAQYFNGAQKGFWNVVVTVHAKDPGNPDRDMHNNQATVVFEVQNKRPADVSDIGIVDGSLCVSDTNKICPPPPTRSHVFTEQPWSVDFKVVNKGNKPILHWSYEIFLSCIPCGAPPIRIKREDFTLLDLGETRRINWESHDAFFFHAGQKGQVWQVDVAVEVKDPTNPEPADRLDNNRAFSQFELVNKPRPEVTDIGIVTACVSDSLKKRCVDTLFTYQPWHVAFLVQNKGNKDVLNWSFHIDLIDQASGQLYVLKNQTPVPQPLPAGGPPVGVNWVAPAAQYFNGGQKGFWKAVVTVDAKDPGNPDQDLHNNQATVVFEVQNKRPADVSDIGIGFLCVTDTNKICPPPTVQSRIFTEAPWSVDFTVVNKGNKPILHWSFGILLSRPGTPPIQIKREDFTLLDLGETRRINWESDSARFFHTPDDKGKWQVQVVVEVKDPSNPEPPDRLDNNRATTTFGVVNNPVTATLLALFQVEPVSDGLELRWQFGDPGQIAAVALERGDAARGPWGRVAAERRDESRMTVALDRSVQAGWTYYYRLVVRTVGGESVTFGPLAGTAGAGIAEFALPRVAPNPTRGPTRIEFTVAREARVRVTIVDVQGREVATLAEGVRRPGVYQATWSGRTERGEAAVGLYFVRYQTPEKDLVRRLVLTR